MLHVMIAHPMEFIKNPKVISLMRDIAFNAGTKTVSSLRRL